MAGIAIFTLGIEIAITVILTYITDSYPEKAAECTVSPLPRPHSGPAFKVPSSDTS
jgi:hypothetical protein